MSVEKLQKRFELMANIGHASSMLMWDDAVMMPPGGGSARADALASLAAVNHETLISSELADAIEAAEQEPLNEWQAANVRRAKDEHKRACAIPTDLVSSLTRVRTRCEQKWRELRAQNDWNGIVDDLSEVFNLSLQRASCLSQATGESDYDALITDYEPELRQSRIDSLFDDLCAFLPAITDEAISRQVTPQPIVGSFGAEQQMELARRLMKAVGFDFSRGRVDTSHHPFCGGDPDDTRITTRFTEAGFLESMMAVLHETGHAMYEQGLPVEWRRQPVGQAAGMATHESQSLFVEMQVCRTREFQTFALPIVREVFGVSDADGPIHVDNVLAHVQHVARDYIRVDADETTYPLHVILRYRLEQRILNGEVSIADIPHLWNESMQDFFGLSTEGNYRNGCMQDVHWFTGLIGYFPCYTIGALMAAQLAQSCAAEIGDIGPDISEGKFDRVVDWVRANVHSRGSLQTGLELVESVTGRPLGTAALRSHLERRYCS